MDLNGVLVHRSYDKGRRTVARPGCANFLKALTNKATVVIWSCAMKKNVDNMSQTIFGSSSVKKEDLIVLSQSEITKCSFPTQGVHAQGFARYYQYS